jgi:pSer/pThr/pTyr-binding forkhead associated (FHA) protein
MSTFWLKLHDMRFPLRVGETLLGRSPYCSIVMNDGLISRQHAAVRVTRDSVHIEDLGSRNGTFVNQQKISGSRKLAAGDRVEIGSQLIFVEVEAREERPRRDTLAVTGEYQAQIEEVLDTPTEPGRTPSYQETLRR